MKPVGGLIAKFRRRIDDPGSQPAFPELAKQGFAFGGVVILATLYIGFLGLPMPVCFSLGFEDLGLLVAVGVDPSGEPAFALAPPAVADSGGLAVQSRHGPSPEVLRVAHGATPGPRTR